MVEETRRRSRRSRCASPAASKSRVREHGGSRVVGLLGATKPSTSSDHPVAGRHIASVEQAHEDRIPVEARACSTRRWPPCRSTKALIAQFPIRASSRLAGRRHERVGRNKEPGSAPMTTANRTTDAMKHLFTPRAKRPCRRSWRCVPARFDSTDAARSWCVPTSAGSRHAHGDSARVPGRHPRPRSPGRTLAPLLIGNRRRGSCAARSAATPSTRCAAARRRELAGTGVVVEDKRLAGAALPQPHPQAALVASTPSWPGSDPLAVAAFASVVAGHGESGEERDVLEIVRPVSSATAPPLAARRGAAARAATSGLDAHLVGRAAISSSVPSMSRKIDQSLARQRGRTRPCRAFVCSS